MPLAAGAAQGSTHGYDTARAFRVRRPGYGTRGRPLPRNHHSQDEYSLPTPEDEQGRIETHHKGVHSDPGLQQSLLQTRQWRMDAQTFQQEQAPTHQI